MEITTPLLTSHEAADYLGVSYHTINWWRCHGKGPRFVKFGTGRRSPVRYRLSDLQDYLVLVTPADLREQEVDHV